MRTVTPLSLHLQKQVTAEIIPATSAPMPAGNQSDSNPRRQAKATSDSSPPAARYPTGGTITLKVVAVGRNLTYEWQQDGTKIGGATTAEYTITGANGGNKGMYKSNYPRRMRN